MLSTLEAVISGSACLTIAVGVPSAVLALLSVSNADRGNEISINFPGTWEAEAVPYGTSFGDLESIAAAGIFTAVVAACTLCLIRLQPHSSRAYTASFFLQVASVVVALEAFLYSFISTYTSDEPPQGPFSTETLGYIGRHGTYSLEAWTCGVKDLGRLSMYGAFTKMCPRTRAARWLMLPLVILTIASAGLSWKWRKDNKPTPKPADSVRAKEMTGRSDSAS